MFWFIIFLIIFVIIASIVDFSCNGWTITKQFFTDSGWGIIAIASGILALILFYASSKSYSSLKINESFLPNPKRDKNKKGKTSMSLIKKENGVVEYDLSQLTMSTLTKKMAYEMTKPGPVFFKGWGNSRLLLDVERVRILQQYIDSIRSTGESLMELQADAFLSYEKIKALTEEKRYQFKKRVIDSKIALDFAKEEYTHKLEMMRLEREGLKKMLNLKKHSENKLKHKMLLIN